MRLLLTIPLILAANTFQEDVDSLVRKLGSDVIEEREKATQALLKLGTAARPALLQALGHKDGEVSRRARAILNEVEAHSDFTLSFFDRVLEEESESPQRLLHRLQKWATRVFEGKSWIGIPGSFDRQGLSFESLRDYGEDQKRALYRYCVKRDAVNFGDAKFSAWISIEVGRKVSEGSRTEFRILSAQASLGIEVRADHRVACARLEKVKAIGMAVAQPQFAEAASEFPFVRSIEMTFGPFYRRRREEVPSGIEVRCEMASLGEIRSGSYECRLVSGLEPVRVKGEPIQNPFVPADTLALDGASKGGWSGPIGHGMKRLDLPPVRDPFHHTGFSVQFPHVAYAIPDIAALPMSASRVRVRVSDCSADDLRPLGRLKRLSFLDLSDCRIDDDAAAFVSRLTSLEELWLSAKALTDRGLRSLASLNGLKSLYVEESQLSDDALDVLKSLPELTYLGLSGWGELTDDGMKRIGSQAGLTRLYLASIRRLTDAGIGHLGGLKQLDTVEFAWLRNLTSASAATLAGLPALRDLGFTSGNVDDAWMAELGKIKKLQFLMAHQCGKITDAGLLHLKDLKDLRRLNIDDKATEAGMKALKGMLPGEYVTY